MSDRELVIELVSKLPEDTTLQEISRKIQLLSGIKKAREQARNGEGIPVEAARNSVDSWFSGN